jgi:hypothetical protein
MITLEGDMVDISILNRREDSFLPGFIYECKERKIDPWLFSALHQLIFFENYTH